MVTRYEFFLVFCRVYAYVCLDDRDAYFHGDALVIPCGNGCVVSLPTMIM